MRKSLERIVAGGVILFGLMGFIKGVDFLTYSTRTIAGVVSDVQITLQTEAKLAPDWIPLPGFDGRNRLDVPSYTIVTLTLPSGAEYVAALCNYNNPEIPAIGENAELRVSRFGVVRPIIGDEPQFSDGTPNYNYARSFPVIEGIN